MLSFQIPQTFTAENAEYVAEINHQILTSKNKKEYKMQDTKTSCKTHRTQRTETFAEKKDGSCFFFTKENTCKINSIKPSICSLEPFIITDFDCRTNEVFLGLNPLAVKNCKGISAGENVALEEIGKAAQTIVDDFLEMVAQKTGLSITDKKVAFLTRQLLNDSNLI
ncbi:MAG: YkgJ family cysteine cluster protein [Candidatus Bathyarchaeota archaeon]|nr:YkgJ family cysteine cluster protein [Candidatus Bathyarchaeota archaeon]